MKKSVVLIIGIIYIVSIVIVSLLGVQLKGLDPKVYVDHISVIDPDNGERMNKIENPSEYGVNEEYYFVTTFEEGLIVRIQAFAYPENTSWTDINFVYDTTQTIYTVEIEKGGICAITFHERGTALIYPTSTDGVKIQTSVRIYAKKPKAS